MRKGGFEISMNFFILLIVSVFLLVIAYYIYRNGLSGLTGALCRATTDALNDMLSIMSMPPAIVC